MIALRARAADALMSCDEAYELQHLVGATLRLNANTFLRDSLARSPFDRPLM